MKIIKHTKGTCPKCKTLLPSTIVAEGNKVYMTRFCKEHGKIKTLKWGDATQYIKFNKMENMKFIDKKNLLLLEITRKCPLNCSNCFNKSCMDTPVKDMSLSEISNMFNSFVDDSEKEPFGVMLCGGEPTLRDDLPEIIRMGKKAGIQQIFLNTNGIRIAEDSDFLKKVCDAGLNTIYLQFNDLKIDKLLPTNNKIKNFQRKIFTNLKSTNINSVFLVPTIVKGFNDDIVYDFVKFGIEKRDIITGISFHCAMHTGEMYDKYTPNRITPYEIMKKIETDSDGAIAVSDFFPFNYTYPLSKIITYVTGVKLHRFFYSFECGVGTTLILEPNGKFTPISRIIDIELLEQKLREILNHISTNRGSKLFLKAYVTKEIFKILSNKYIIKMKKARTLMNSIFSIRNIKDCNKIKKRAFTIIISQFLDPYNFDVDCNKRCADDIGVVKNGKIYKFPFCHYNIFKRDEFEGT